MILSIPSAIFLDTRLNNAHKDIYATLGMYGASFDRWCYPSIQTLSKSSGFHRSHVINVIKDLIEWGYILKKKRLSNKGDHTSNLYKVIMDVGLPPREFRKEGIKYLPFGKNLGDEFDDGGGSRMENLGDSGDDDLTNKKPNQDEENIETPINEGGSRMDSTTDVECQSTTNMNNSFNLNNNLSLSLLSLSLSSEIKEEKKEEERREEILNLDLEEEEERNYWNQNNREAYCQQTGMSEEKYDKIAAEARAWIEKKEDLGDEIKNREKLLLTFLQKQIVKEQNEALERKSSNFSTDIDGHISSHEDSLVQKFLCRVRKRWGDAGYTSWMMHTKSMVNKATNILEIIITGSHARRFIYDSLVNPLKLRSLEEDAKLMGFHNLRIAPPSRDVG